jgi:hypothetical protein
MPSIICPTFVTPVPSPNPLGQYQRYPFLTTARTILRTLADHWNAIVSTRWLICPPSAGRQADNGSGKSSQPVWLSQWDDLTSWKGFAVLFLKVTYIRSLGAGWRAERSSLINIGGRRAHQPRPHISQMIAVSATVLRFAVPATPKQEARLPVRKLDKFVGKIASRAQT